MRLCRSPVEATTPPHGTAPVLNNRLVIVPDRTRRDRQKTTLEPSVNPVQTPRINAPPKQSANLAESNEIAETTNAGDYNRTHSRVNPVGKSAKFGRLGELR